MVEETALQVVPRKRRVGKRGGDLAQVACCAPVELAPIEEQEALAVAANARALADPTRVRIVMMLAQHAGEVCVCDITSAFNLDQSTISHHLRLLREAGIIDVVRHGVWAYYFLHAGALQALRQFIEYLPAS